MYETFPIWHVNASLFEYATRAHAAILPTAGGYLVAAVAVAASVAWHLRGGLKWRRTVVHRALPLPQSQEIKRDGGNRSFAHENSPVKLPASRAISRNTPRSRVPVIFAHKSAVNISHETYRDRCYVQSYIRRRASSILWNLCVPPCNYPPRSAFNDFDVRINSRWLYVRPATILGERYDTDTGIYPRFYLGVTRSAFNQSRGFSQGSGAARFCSLDAPRVSCLMRFYVVCLTDLLIARVRGLLNILSIYGLPGIFNRSKVSTQKKLHSHMFFLHYIYRRI